MGGGRGGQAPGAGGRMGKVESAARGRARSKTDAETRRRGDWTRRTEEKQARRPALLSKRIPEAGSEVVEHRAAGRGVEEVAAAEGVEGQVEGFGDRDADAGARLDEVGPVLMTDIGGQV